MRIREIAQARVRYGYPTPATKTCCRGPRYGKIRVLLNREGWDVGKHLVYRLYKEEGLEQNQQRCAQRQGCQTGFFIKKNPTSQMPNRVYLC